MLHHSSSPASKLTASALQLRPVRSVFICGCGHSGTTLMANMLAAHPEAHVPLWETAIFFRRPVAAAVRYNQLKWQTRASGKRYLVEKTPRHVHKLPLIRKIAPRSRFVFPVRDGRDVAASIYKRGMSLEEGIQRWIDDNLIVLEQAERNDSVVYRHEDLITDTSETLRRVCEAIDLPYSDRLLAYHEEERLWYGVDGVKAADPDQDHENHRNWQINQPIFDNRGRWKKELKDADIESLYTGQGREVMEALGYL